MPDARRDPRIDALRGLALAMIYVNHIPGTVWEGLTSRNFGFSDAAEGFVVISGIAAGLAYGPGFAAGRPGAWRRPVARAALLWAVHLAVTAGCIAVAVAGLRWLGTEVLAQSHNLAPVLADPRGTLPGLVLLGHQLGYANVLPLYVVLMAVAPALLWLAVRWPGRLLAGSLALWLLAGLLGLNLPNFPAAGGWYFNPLAWQLLFVAGLLTGLALRRGARVLPLRRGAVALAAGFLVLAALWVRLPAVAEGGGHLLWLLAEHAGLPPLLTGFDKTHVALPRLLHILALAYLLGSMPGLRRLAGAPAAAPLRLLGRHALPVFATGTVLAYAAQAVKEAAAPSAALDAALVFGGLALLLALAARQDRSGPGLAALPRTA